MRCFLACLVAGSVSACAPMPSSMPAPPPASAGPARPAAAPASRGVAVEAAELERAAVKLAAAVKAL